MQDKITTGHKCYESNNEGQEDRNILDKSFSHKALVLLLASYSCEDILRIDDVKASLSKDEANPSDQD